MRIILIFNVPLVQWHYSLNWLIRQRQGMHSFNFLPHIHSLNQRLSNSNWFLATPTRFAVLNWLELQVSYNSINLSIMNSFKLKCNNIKPIEFIWAVLPIWEVVNQFKLNAEDYDSTSDSNPISLNLGRDISLLINCRTFNQSYKFTKAFYCLSNIGWSSWLKLVVEVRHSSIFLNCFIQLMTLICQINYAGEIKSRRKTLLSLLWTGAILDESWKFIWLIRRLSAQWITLSLFPKLVVWSKNQEFSE